MLEYVAAAVNAGSLTVPHTDHAVVTRPGAKSGLLRAPNGCRAEIFVNSGSDFDVVAFEERARPQELLIETPKRRASVPRDKERCAQSGSLVCPPLVHRQAHEGLYPGQICASIFERVFVIKRYCRKHAQSSHVPYLATEI